MISDDPFVRYKSRHVIAYSMINAVRLHEVRYALEWNQRPLEGRTVIVVGAGPSLAKNGHRLRDAMSKGVPIFAVNASDAPLRELGVRPDVLTIRESLDLSDQAEATTARAVALDVGVHPSTWDALVSRDDLRTYAWLPCYPRHMQWIRRIGVRPIFGGTSALCSAVSLAFEWGAAKVVLVGVDLAMGDEGRVYHEHAPRGEARAEEAGDVLEFTGDEQDAERARRSGQRPQPDSVAFENVVAHDWSGVRPALTTWQNQRDWLQIEAERRKGWTEFVNATEGGGGILWWRTETLESVLDDEWERDPFELPEGRQIPRDVTDQIRADELLASSKQAQVNRELLDEDHGPDMSLISRIPGVVEGSQLLEAFAGWQLLDAPKEMGEGRLRYMARCFLESAEEARSILAPEEAAQ